MPNMRDIARLAGVSIGTVSLALRNSERISEATRARIQDIAADYGYIPNRLSQAILSGKSRILGCIIHRQFGPHFARILGGVLEQASRHDHSVMVFQTAETVEAVEVAVRNLLEHRVEGITLMIPAITEAIHTKALLATRSAGVYLVAIAEVSSLAPGDLVICNIEAFARLMIDHIWTLGHRQVAFLGHQHPVTVEYRLPVYLRIMKQYGLPTDRVALVTNQQEGVNVMAGWLHERSRPTAVITDDDSFATTLMQSAGSLGVRIPEDLSVMGTGNFHHAFIYPLVSTVEKHPVALGHEAVNLLIRRIQDGMPPEECPPIVHEVEPTLLKRDTTAPLSHLRREEQDTVTKR